MSNQQKNIQSPDAALFDRVVSILEQARGNVVRAINSNMVMAYWLIGREMVQELQDGSERAEYGKQVVSGLSKRLNEKYGKGFSVANIKNFRQFYLAYSDRLNPIGYPAGSQFVDEKNLCQLGAKSEKLLERQVHTQYYDRTLHAQQPDKMIAEGRQIQKTPTAPNEILKNPYVLDFLGYPNFAEVRETDVEQAIITHLQRFLLELGAGFAFVG